MNLEMQKTLVVALCLAGITFSDLPPPSRMLRDGLDYDGLYDASYPGHPSPTESALPGPVDEIVAGWKIPNMDPPMSVTEEKSKFNTPSFSSGGIRNEPFDPTTVTGWKSWVAQIPHKSTSDIVLTDDSQWEGFTNEGPSSQTTTVNTSEGIREANPDSEITVIRSQNQNNRRELHAIPQGALPQNVHDPRRGLYAARHFLPLLLSWARRGQYDPTPPSGASSRYSSGQFNSKKALKRHRFNDHSSSLYVTSPEYGRNGRDNPNVRNDDLPKGQSSLTTQKVLNDVTNITRFVHETSDALPTAIPAPPVSPAPAPQVASMNTTVKPGNGPDLVESVPSDLVKHLTHVQFSWVDIIIAVSCSVAALLILINLGVFFQYCMQRRRQERNFHIQTPMVLPSNDYSPKFNSICSRIDKIARSNRINCGNNISRTSEYGGSGTRLAQNRSPRQYENSEAIIANYLNNELVVEMNDRDSTCSSVSDGFTFSHEYEADREDNFRL